MTTELTKQEQDREAWLQAKSKFVGASEVSALFGENPYMTTLRLWGLKTGRIKPDPENRYMRLGSRMEPIIAEEYCLATGREIYPQVLESGGFISQLFGDTAMYSSVEAPLSCTPDRLVTQGGPVGTCQLKTTNPYMAHEWRDDDGSTAIPLRVQMQVQAEMAVLGLTWGSAAVLIGGCDFRYGDVEPNPRFVVAMYRKVEEFWFYVRTDQRPPDVTEKDRETLYELYPKATPGRAVQLPPEAVEVTSKLDWCQSSIKANESIVGQCKAQLQAWIGDAEQGILPDGSVWTWKERAGYTVKAHEVAATRILRRSK